MKNKFLDGIVKRHPDGFGFFIPKDSQFPDVFIPQRSMTGVMTNDEVVVQVTEERGKGRFSGEVIRITKHAITQAIGRFVEMNNGGAIMDVNHGWGSILKIKSENTKNAQDGELVIVKVTKYPSDTSDFEGNVIDVIGDAEDPLYDTKRVIIEHQIPHDFNKGIEKELESVPTEVDQKEFKDRNDLTHLSLITIDGVTAKDFDDAIYAEQTHSGFKLIVAIADVSHYVKVNSSIDDEAYKRGTSTYFPNHVVPMLPEKLSNGICSLMPEVNRLAMTAEIEIDYAGNIQKKSFYESVIKSHARVTYGEAQEILDGHTPEKLNHVEDMIKLCSDIAKILMTKRFKEGSLDFDIPETQVIVDDAGYAIDIQKAERIFSNKLIEEFMLITNVAVAQYLREKDTPGIHRIHEEPDSKSIGLLNRYVHNFGGGEKISGGKLQKRISRVLEKFKGTQYETIMGILTLRSMKQAKYSAEPIGHFGLAFPDYAHFTSPIRRYPDLIIHRQLKSIILNSDKGYRALREGDLDSAGVHLSACEQRSVKAERQLYSIKKARLLENAIGEEFDGVISSVTKFGIFVLLRDYDVDGLVKLENLGDDHFTFEEESLSLVGKRSGVEFKIGDAARVQVAAVDTQQGQIDFELIGVKQRGTSVNRKTASKKPKKRGKTKGNRRRSSKSRVSRRS